MKANGKFTGKGVQPPINIEYVPLSHTRDHPAEVRARAVRHLYRHRSSSAEFREWMEMLGLSPADIAPATHVHDRVCATPI